MKDLRFSQAVMETQFFRINRHVASEFKITGHHALEGLQLYLIQCHTVYEYRYKKVCFIQ